MKLTKNTKEWVQFYASLVLLVAGINLVFVALLLEPVGVIHYSVLSAFGMLLTFVGAVWQLDVKYTFKTEEMRNQMILRDKDEKYQEMRRRYGMEEEEETDYENPETL
jgi:hypothetical protein